MKQLKKRNNWGISDTWGVQDIHIWQKEMLHNLQERYIPLPQEARQDALGHLVLL